MLSLIGLVRYLISLNLLVSMIQLLIDQISMLRLLLLRLLLLCMELLLALKTLVHLILIALVTKWHRLLIEVLPRLLLDLRPKLLLCLRSKLLLNLRLSLLSLELVSCLILDRILNCPATTTTAALIVSWGLILTTGVIVSRTFICIFASERGLEVRRDSRKDCCCDPNVCFHGQSPEVARVAM